MTKHPELFAALAAPFEPEEVKVRSQASRQLHYVTARTVMNRFDNVLGPENWFDEYVPNENSVVCRLTVRLPDGATLTKADAGGYAGMADSGDDDKSGYSDAFKRAAVKFGVARYLYRDGVPTFVQERSSAPPPEPPAPPAPTPAPKPAPRPGTNGHTKQRHEWAGANGATHAPARTNGTAIAPAPTPVFDGSALYEWARATGQENGCNLLQGLSKWGSTQRYPARIKSWSVEQAAKGYAQACKALEENPS